MSAVSVWKIAFTICRSTPIPLLRCATLRWAPYGRGWSQYLFRRSAAAPSFRGSGRLYLEIRDTRYGGNANWQYCIEINDRPFVTNVYPLRVTPGRATRLRLLGHNLPPEPFASLTLPANTHGFRRVRETHRVVAPACDEAVRFAHPATWRRPGLQTFGGPPPVPSRAIRRR